MRERVHPSFGATQHKPRTDRRRTAVDAALVVVLVAAGGHLLLWRGKMLPHVGIAGWVLFAVETVAVLWMVLSAALLTGRASPNQLAPKPDGQLTLDVLIPVAGEPIELLSATVVAAKEIDWPCTIVVCNDNYMAGKANWREIEKLCGSIGVQCVTRRTGVPGKAGNLNNAIRYSGSDVILVLDADHRVVPDVAQQMLGWFHHDDVAFVSTPQEYEGSATDPLNSAEPIFYRAIQPARDRHGLAFSTGTGVMYRRSAIDRIGGFSEWSVVEDLHTSIRLHDQGWRSVFHPRPVTIGLAPSTSAEYARQRMRWAVDSLRILRHDPPWLRHGLSGRAKLHYSHTLISYVVAIVQAAFLLGPPAWIVGRLSMLSPSGWQAQTGHFLPWLVALAATLTWWAGPKGAIRSLRLWVAFLPAVFMVAAGRVFTARHERGGTTNKVEQPRLNRLVLAGLVLPALLLATLVWGLFDSRPGGSDLAMLWAAVMFSLSIGPVLHFGRGVGWGTIASSALVALALTIAGGSVATVRLGWEPPGELYTSFRSDPVTRDVIVTVNEFGDDLVLGPAVPVEPRTENRAVPGMRVSLGDTSGIYVGFTSDALPFDIGDMNRWAGRAHEPQIVHWYQQWGSGESRFRGDWLAQVDAAGRIPMISWEAWAKPPGSFHSNIQELGRMRDIADGNHDEYIDEWATAAAEYGRPVLLRPFHEMNGSWYPWSVGVNGNDADDYVAGWRHMVERFEAAGATNVTFVWSVNTFLSLDQGREVRAYYPGDEYVDWVAMSGFNWGDYYAEWSSWQTAEEVFSVTYEVLETFGKPVMFAEIGTDTSGGDGAQWVTEAMSWFGTLPGLDAIVWFDRSYDGNIDFRLRADQQAAFRLAVTAGSIFGPDLELTEHPILDDLEGASE